MPVSKDGRLTVEEAKRLSDAMTARWGNPHRFAQENGWDPSYLGRVLKRYKGAGIGLGQLRLLVAQIGNDFSLADLFARERREERPLSMTEIVQQMRYLTEQMARLQEMPTLPAEGRSWVEEIEAEATAVLRLEDQAAGTAPQAAREGTEPATAQTPRPRKSRPRNTGSES